MLKHTRTVRRNSLRPAAKPRDVISILLYLGGEREFDSAPSLFVQVRAESVILPLNPETDPLCTQIAPGEKI